MDFSTTFFKDLQGDEWRVVVSEFRGEEYLHIRRYYSDMEGEFLPTKTGISFKHSLSVVAGLYLALARLLSEYEISDLDIDAIYEEFNEKDPARTISRERIDSLLRREPKHPGFGV